jgi:drug/metabolite transporter (DMT)-like permease
MPIFDYILLIGTGIFGWLCQECISIAISMELAGRVAVLNYLQIVICFIFDISFLDRKVHWSDLLGTFMIIFFSFLGALKKCFIPPEKPKTVQYEIQENVETTEAS